MLSIISKLPNSIAYFFRVFNAVFSRFRYYFESVVKSSREDLSL